MVLSFSLWDLFSNLIIMSLHWDDVECPYCWAMQDIYHDDGYWYQEDETYEQQCSECEKNFAYTTSIIYCYNAEKADCLNGWEHDLKVNRSWPKEFSKMACRDCSYTRRCTDEEIVSIT